jgi:hypothetical protein
MVRGFRAPQKYKLFTENNSSGAAMFHHKKRSSQVSNIWEKSYICLPYLFKDTLIKVLAFTFTSLIKKFKHAK